MTPARSLDLALLRGHDGHRSSDLIFAVLSDAAGSGSDHRGWHRGAGSGLEVAHSLFAADAPAVDTHGWIGAPGLSRALHGGTAAAPLRVLVQQVWFSGASAALFLSAATELGMAQWLAASAETARGYPAWVGGAILLDFSIPMAAGRMAMGVAGHRHDPNRLMAAGCAL